MKRLLVSASLLAFAGIVSAQDEADHVKWMKSIAATSGGIRKNIEAKSAAEVSADATKLAAMYKTLGEFYASRSMADAVTISKTGETGATEAAAAATAGDLEKAAASMKTVGGTCRDCHTAHREKTETGYKIK
jgi:cytochrome c2